MIRAAAFDLDDTLYDCEGIHGAAMEEAFSACRARLGTGREDFFGAVERARLEVKAALGEAAACHDRMLYFQRAAEILGARPAGAALDIHDAYWGAMLRAMRPRAGARELLSACRERGVRIAVCTDQLAHVQHRKLRALGLEGLVDVLVTSEEAGAEKPSPAIFGLLLEKLGLEPREVLFVGDSLERDVEGAAAAGMAAFWLHDEGTGMPCAEVPVGRILGIIDGGGSLEDAHRARDAGGGEDAAGGGARGD